MRTTSCALVGGRGSIGTMDRCGVLGYCATCATRILRHRIYSTSNLMDRDDQYRTSTVLYIPVFQRRVFIFLSPAEILRSSWMGTFIYYCAYIW